MSTPSPAKKALTLVWSIGLGVVLMMITSVLLMPSTKSASPRLRSNNEAGAGAPLAENADSEDSPPLPSSKRMILPVPAGREEYEEAPHNPDTQETEEVAEEDDRPILYGSKSAVWDGMAIPFASESEEALENAAAPSGGNPAGGQPTEPAAKPREVAPEPVGQGAPRERRQAQGGEGTP